MGSKKNQPLFSLSLIEAAAGTRLANSSDIQGFSNFSTDTRTIKQGDLFVPIKGDNFDGHTFINEAFKKGAAATLTENNLSKDFPHFKVPSVLSAFRSVAKAWREEFNFPILAVAGSNGKTTTKELLTAIVSSKWKPVLKTRGSENGFWGIPMTLLKLRKEHKAAVIEVGIDDVGAMESHMEIIRPTAAVLTTIGPEHLEKLKNIETVAEEELKCLEWIAKNGGTYAVNLDDPFIAKMGRLLCKKTPKNCFEFSLKNADFEDLKNPLPGVHNQLNLLAAVSLAKALGFSSVEISRGLKSFTPPPGRNEIRDYKGSTFLCDWYNSSPPSLEAALNLVRTLVENQVTPKSNAAPKVWICLGDMLELGSEEESFHRALATPIRFFKNSEVLLFGPRMKALENELSKLEGVETTHFDSKQQLSEKLFHGIRPGDVILIKGSRSMKMEDIWPAK